MVRHDKVNKEKKQQKSLPFIIVMVAIVVIALLSAIFIIKPGDEIVPIITYSPSDYETYHGFKFEESGEFWITKVELQGVPYEAPFYNHPLDLQDISFDENITDYVLSVPHANFIIAVSDDVGATPVLAGANIGRITGKLYGMPTSSALYALPADRDGNQIAYPYVDCSDATSTTPIFWMNVNASEQAVYFDEENPHCIIVAATSNEEILESADLFAYHILQIE